MIPTQPVRHDPTAKPFADIGTKLETVNIAPRNPRRIVTGNPFSVDVGASRGKEWFVLRYRRPVSLKVHDVRPDIKHLLLEVDAGGDTRHKFLMGHDERHYFVAGVPLGTRNVQDAMERLMPDPVALRAANLPEDERYTRRNKAFVRQGEWFFVPATASEHEQVDGIRILRNEPLRRGRSKPHVVDELIRFGGDDVLVHRLRPNGVTHEEYQKIVQGDGPRSLKSGWTHMRRNPVALVRGKVRHPDHATITLADWHRVHMNQETTMPGQGPMAFLD